MAPQPPAAASGDGQKEEYRKLSGAQKAAIILMSIDEENATKILNSMSDEEIKEISNTMSSLGTVRSDVVERLYVDFVENMSSSGVVVGTFDSTERLLLKALGKDRVDNIMEDIRGPAGRTTWDKLGNVNEEVLATFLKNEYPQTIAVVLSKIKAEHAARVLATFPEDLTLEVIMRMLNMESVKKDVLDGIEKTLRLEFMNNLAKTQRRDTHEIMAEIFNNFDRNTESKYMSVLEQKNQESAERIRALMFTFEDLKKVDPSGMQTLMRNVPKEKLGVAMKGASEAIKELFFKSMSERAAKLLKDDMEALGPVRLKDVDEAQMAIVQVAKELAAKGEIIIAGDSGGDQLVY
jgi:flagellar motor switch protein FliG